MPIESTAPTNPLAPRPLALLVGLLSAASLFGTTATTTLPVIAPEAARAYGIPAIWVGYQFAVVSASIMVSLLLLSGASRRLGACRTAQLGVLVTGTGLALALLPGLPALLAASVGMGLGYGLLMPAVSHLMLRYTPPARLNLAYSIQQSGIPLGAAIAAWAGPTIAVSFGWRWAVLAASVPLIVLAAVLGLRRAAWDDDRDRSAPLWRNPLQGLAQVLDDGRLRHMAVAGACLSACQFCVLTYTVVALVEIMDYPLVVAGAMLTLAQVFGMGSRIACGWLADRRNDALLVLVCLGIAVLAVGCASALLSPRWPLAAVALLFIAQGAATSGWPGAFLAQVGRISGPARAATGTAGVLLLGGFGKTLGPLAFVAIHGATGGYAAAYAFLGMLGGIGALGLLAARRAPGPAAGAA